MKYIPTISLTPGMMVGHEVVAENGVVLLEKGLSLTKTQIANLQSWKVRFVCIHDDTAMINQASSRITLTKVGFMKKYRNCLNSLQKILEESTQYKQLPIIGIRTLADKMIRPLTTCSEALDYLHAMEAHCNCTFHHMLNVAIITGIISRWLKCNTLDCENLILAGLLHDIGKLSIPVSILNKSEKLSDIEFDIVKKHPLHGYRFVENSADIPASVKLVIAQHHERMDGSGYPFGLKGEEIHNYSKIVAIADIYDAMISDRPYRPKLSPFTVVEIIIEQTSDKLDPCVCIPLIDRMRDHFIGSDVLLSNGQQAKLIVLPARNWTKPLVRTRDGKLLDLQKEQIQVVAFASS